MQTNKWMITGHLDDQLALWRAGSSAWDYMTNLEEQVYVSKTTSLPLTPHCSTFGQHQRNLRKPTCYIREGWKGSSWSKDQIQDVQYQGVFSFTLWNRNQELELVFHIPKIFTQLEVRHSKSFSPSRYTYGRSPQVLKMGEQVNNCILPSTVSFLLSSVAITGGFVQVID